MRIPGCREGADASEEKRWLDIDVDSQGQLPVIALHFASSSRILEVQHGFQGLKCKIKDMVVIY